MRVVFNREGIEVIVPINPMLEYMRANSNYQEGELESELIDVALTKLSRVIPIDRSIEEWSARIEVD